MDSMGSEISNFPSLVRDKTVLEESSTSESEDLVKEDLEKKKFTESQNEIFIHNLEENNPIAGNDLSNEVSLEEIKSQNSVDQNSLSCSLHSSQDSKIGESQNSTPNEWELNISHIPESSKDEQTVEITHTIFNEEMYVVSNSNASFNHKIYEFPCETKNQSCDDLSSSSSFNNEKLTTNVIKNSHEEQFHDDSFSKQSPSKVSNLIDKTQSEPKVVHEKLTEEELNKEKLNNLNTTVHQEDSEDVLVKTSEENVESDFKAHEDIANLSEPIEKNSFQEDSESPESKCQLNMGYMPMELIYSTVRMKELEIKCKEYKQELDLKNKLFIEKEAECLRLKEEIIILKDQLKNVKTAIGVETSEDSATHICNKQKSQYVTNGHSLRSSSRKSPISLRNRNNVSKINRTEKIDKKESLTVEEEYLKRFAKKGLSRKKLVKKSAKERKPTKEKVNKSKEVLDDIGIFCFSPESKKFKESNIKRDSSKLVKRSKSEKKNTEKNFDGIGVMCFRSETRNQKRASNRDTSWVKRKKMPCRAQRTRSISPVKEEDESITKHKARTKISSRRKLKFDF